MFTIFKDLGDSIKRKSEQAKQDLDRFIEIAATELEESDLLNRIEPEEIVSWLINSQELPSQNLHEFGQPPINLYVAEHFYIQALFWIDGTTAIHEHAFAGAFGVLHGSSVHTTYAFTPERTVSDRVILGQVNFLGSELLSRGDIRSIYPADKLIHALFHLDRPSVSVVVRTNKTIGKRPQHYYAKPCLALNDNDLPAHAIIQRRMLESLWKSNRSHFWNAAKDMAAKCDPFMLYQTLSLAFLDTTDSQSWEELLNIARKNHPDLIDHFLPCLRDENRSERIRSFRNNVHDPVHRFFLALLLNVPSREELFHLIGQRFPGENPRSLAIKWLSEIFEKEQSGVKLNRSWLCLIERMLENPEFEQSREFLRVRFKSNDAKGEEKLRTAWDRLRSFEFIKPLLNTTSTTA